ncbi:MAG: CBS domain-containing protein [Candidatus Kariarchaeaceae archaeon]|jgi:CBS domain-containing protein
MDFKEFQVGNYAKKSAIISNLNETVGYVIDNMIKYQVRQFPIITEEGTLAGIITSTDILRCMYETGTLEFLKKQVKDVMTTETIIAKSDYTVRDVILMMYNSGISGVPVVSDGNVDGLFTDKDILSLDEIWDQVPDTTIIGAAGIGRRISSDDIVTENHTLWQVSDKIIQTGQRQILFMNTETNQYDGVITISAILSAIVSTIIAPDRPIDLQTTDIQAITKQPIEKMSTPISINEVRKYMVANNIEAVPLFDIENTVILVTEKDLVGYLSTTIQSD